MALSPRTKPDWALDSAFALLAPRAGPAEHTIVGMIAGLVLGVFDALAAAVRDRGLEVDALSVAIGGLYLAAMYLLPGAIVGAAIGVLVAGIRKSGWLVPIVRRRSFVERDPRFFAGVVASLIALALVVIAGHAALHAIPSRVATASVVPIMSVLAVLGIAAGGVVVAMLLAGLLVPLARLLGGIASIGGLVFFATLGLGGAAFAVVRYASDRLRAFDGWASSWPVLAAVVYIAVALCVRRIVLWRLPRANGVRLLALAALVLSALTLFGAGSVYGTRNRVRLVVEQRAVWGRFLIRAYIYGADRDGDGYAALFGGGDCDDSSARVHPGATDVKGDGVDADCFDGDGSRLPPIDRTLGQYDDTPPGPEHPNFVVFLVDAMRPDHLGFAGYPQPTSPAMDRFAARSVWFSNTSSSSSRTLYALPSMFTGLYPSEVPYGDEHVFRSVGDEVTTFAEVLGQHGYHTVAVLGTTWFNQVPSVFQGFTRLIHGSAYKAPRGEAVTEALRAIDERPENAPFLVWVHLFNVHQDYLEDHTPSQFGATPVGAYDTEIRLADEQFQRLIDGLDTRGLAGNTVVVLASDHGEAFLEHGDYFHGRTLYEEETRATLVMHVPGVSPHRVTTPVSIIDFAPTVLNLARLPMPVATAARSLVPDLEGRSPPGPRPIISEYIPDGYWTQDFKTVREGDRKLIWWPRENRLQLFDLARDPHEQRDVSDDQPAEVQRLFAMLRAFAAQFSRDDSRADYVIARHRLEHPPLEMTQRIDATFGNAFRLIGYDVQPTLVRPGGTVNLLLYIEVLSRTDESLLFALTGNVRGNPRPALNAGHIPLLGRYPTTRWHRGEFLSDPVRMVVPPETPAGPLQLMLQVNGATAPVQYSSPRGNGYALELGTLQVIR